MKFELKKDKYMLYLISIPLVLSLFISLGALFIDATAAPDVEILIIFITYGIIIYMLYSFYQKSYYLLDEDHLKIQFGFIRFKIDYTQITNIKEASNWWSSLSLSKERVAIYKNGRLWNYLGPLDRDLFIKELKKKVKAFNNIDF